MNSKSFLPLFLLVVLSVIWGSSFILMKEGLKSLSAIQVAALRISIGGMIFTPFVIRFLKKIERKDVKYVILSGILGNGIPAFLFALAQTKVDSSIAGALNALTPMFTLIIGYVFGVIVMNSSKVVGVIIGLAGALAIILGKGDTILTFNNGFQMLIVVATLLYGVNINLIKSKLTKYPAMVISALPLFFISIPGIIILLSTDFTEIAGTGGWQVNRSMAAVALLALLGNSLSLVLFNRLIQISGPVFASSVTYFIPVVALLWGFADHEHISVVQIAGMMLILAGIRLVNKV